MTEKAYIPSVWAEMTVEMPPSPWSFPFMCREVMTMMATMTACPSTMAVTAIIAAGWRRMTPIDRACPSGADDG